MKTARKKLLLTQLFSRLGESLLGVFFPFFLRKTFGLSIPQVFLWGALFYGLLMFFSTVLFPLIRRKVRGHYVLASGLFLSAIFYAVLACPMPNNWWIIGLVTALYSLGTTLFWVEFNTQSYLSNKSASRGKFFAHYQSIMIGVNIIAPIITGLLLDLQLQQYSLLVAVSFLLLAALVGVSIRFPQNYFTSNLALVWQAQKEIWKNRSFRNGLGAFGVGTAFFYLCWAFFFHSVTKDFTQMGLLVGLAAVFEVLSSQLMGRFLKKIPFRNIFWVRMGDIFMRGTLLFFAPTWMVGIVLILGGILGPIFFLPFMNRVHEQAEAYDNSYHVFIFWENALGIARVATALVLFLSTQIFELSTVYLIGICLAALSTLGFRRL